MATCRWCGAPIIWATVEATGAAMPLDPALDPSGRVVVVRRGGDGHDFVRIDGGGPAMDDPADVRRYTAHFASCRAERNRTKVAR